ncbi:MAG: NmrA/HSCARG family protein [Sphaerisporangium sp.]|nr:NmrA/HSCARG family protein [Sphaerisporangium sp.]
MNDTILVTGATGQQGGATASHLLARGWNVRALTRDTSTAAARALHLAGAQVVAGDMDDRASLDAATRGVQGVFSVQPTEGMPGTPPGFTNADQIRWGRNVADAAVAAGVRHLVYTSSNSSEQRTGLGNLESKWEIEEYVRSLDLSATILRPTSFMENYVHPMWGLREGALVTSILPDVTQQLIALEDIAALAALAFEHPEEYRGRAVDLAGDALTPPQVADAISRATGRTVPYVQIPMDELRRQNATAAAGYEFMNSGKGTQADIPALRGLHPGLMTFDAWLEKEGAARIQALLDS